MFRQIITIPIKAHVPKICTPQKSSSRWNQSYAGINHNNQSPPYCRQLLKAHLGPLLLSTSVKKSRARRTKSLLPYGCYQMSK